MRGLGEGPQRQLGRARDADDDRPGRAQDPHELAVLGLRVAVGVGAAHARRPGDCHVVLHGDRHAEQRAVVAAARPPAGLVGLEQRALVEDDPEGVQVAVQARDALERVLDELARRDLTGSHELGLSRDTGEGELATLGRGGRRHRHHRLDLSGRHPCSIRMWC